MIGLPERSSERKGAIGNRRRPPNLNVKPLVARSPWLRLRVGDWRVLYRPLDADELAELTLIRGEPVESGTVFIERIVNRRDLERVIAALP